MHIVGVVHRGASANLDGNISNTLEEDLLHSYSTGRMEKEQAEQHQSNKRSSSMCVPTSKRLCQRGLELDEDDFLGPLLGMELNEVQWNDFNSPQILGLVISADLPDKEDHSLSGDMQFVVEDYLLDEMQEPVELLDQADCQVGVSVDKRQEPAQLPNHDSALLHGGHPRLHRCLLVQKFLTASDVDIKIPGILLPKDKIGANFPNLDAKGLEIRMHDGEENDKTWSMRLMPVNHSSGGRVYRLKESLSYIRCHALKENDLLQMICERDAREECGYRYILKFKRCLPEYKPLFRDTHTGSKTWRLIFQKILTASDAEVGPQSVGSVVLGKKVVQHFPPVPHGEEGLDMMLYDWHVEHIWITKLKRSLHKACDVYRLQNIAEFLRFNAVEEGDLFSILRSDAPDVRYAVQVSKPLAEAIHDRVVDFVCHHDLLAAMHSNHGERGGKSS